MNIQNLILSDFLATAVFNALGGVSHLEGDLCCGCSIADCVRDHCMTKVEFLEKIKEN